MNTEFCIDWLHISEPFKPYALLASFLYQLENFNRLSPQTPRFGYTEGSVNQAGAVVMRNRDRSDMGVHVGYSGKTLNTYRDNGVSNLDMLRWHIGRGASVSRIDLAFDMRETTIKPGGLYEHLCNGRAITTAKNYNLIVGNDGGATLYIGSRQSEAFVRIYDKGIESGIGGNWIRCELELKSSKARFAAFTMANEPDDKAYQWAQAWLQGYVSFPDKDWQTFITQEGIRLVSANKPEPDTRKWLLTQVAPAMARYLNKTGDTKLRDEFLDIVDELTLACDNS